MYRRLAAEKDCYITDAVVSSPQRNASDRNDKANTGLASSIDLFKLYAVHKTGSSDMNEISRALIKFDLNPLRALTSSKLDIAHTSFKCYMQLHDVDGGQPCPSNYTLIVNPLSKSFSEGVGRDVVTFNDIDAANFITASYTSAGPSLWHLSGALKDGLLGSSDLDVITSGNLHDTYGSTSVIAVSQSFPQGTEDMKVDVTRIVSATLAGLLPDHGFRIAFSGSDESDTKTRFVKRFAARHASDCALRPRLLVQYNDSIQDNQANSYFDLTNVVFLYNYDRDGLANVISGSSNTEITGDNCMILRLITDMSGGQYTKTVSASQHKIGTMYVTGVYSASFQILSSDASLSYRLALSSSLTFQQIWGSVDGKVGYHTASNYVMTKMQRRVSDRTQRPLLVHATNVSPSYTDDDHVRLRVFIDDTDATCVAKKMPVEKKSTIANRAYYSIRDSLSDVVIVPFETESHGTRMSTDDDGMYFDVYMNDLDFGHVYDIDVLIKDDAVEKIYRSVGPRFRVDRKR